MATGAFSEMLLSYDPAATGDLVRRRGRAVRSRAISLGITVALLVLLWFWQQDLVRGPGAITLYAVVLGISLAWLVVSIVLWLRVRKEMTRLGTGTAVRVGPWGIELAGLALPWAEVATLAARNGGLGRGPQVRLTAVDGRTSELSLDHVSLFPATLDSTVRAFSAGRHGLDLSMLDN